MRANALKNSNSVSVPEAKETTHVIRTSIPEEVTSDSQPISIQGVNNSVNNSDIEIPDNYN